MGLLVSAVMLFAASVSLYPGEIWCFTLFSVVANAMLFYALRREALFLDLFLAIFLWLGFWLKLVVRLLTANGYFVEAAGSFEQFDQAVMIGSVGLLAVMFASWIREHYMFRYPADTPLGLAGLYAFYQQYRRWVLVLFVIGFSSVAILNFWLGIYQRGEIPTTYLPYGANGVFKWLLIFGMASFSATILRFELELNKRATLMPAVLAMLEACMSSVSMMSRAMIINVSALGLGVLKTVDKQKFSWQWWQVALISTLFVLLFAASVVSVNYLRAINYNILSIESGETTSEPISTQTATEETETDVDKENVVEKPASITEPDNEIDLLEDSINKFQLVMIMTRPLFIDRWVGFEGVLGVLHHGQLGWDLWQEAWQESYLDNQVTLYDKMIDSAYVDIDTSKHHFVNLPGMIAFLFYPGSYLFLFLAMTIVVLMASLLEVATFKVAGQNLVLSALIAQVVVFRVTNFGYVPGQSYLLFGAMILNLLIIFLAERLCATSRIRH